ncbi:MAG: UDP-N-acetylglucosamine--N-acetylmuramyl-(pentapeptide) pyrophosphoryl-undecaprenol N-acetylglucosamine transferase [Gemmatimonadaceae bacterium]
MRVFFTGGGTGGHLYPALAIARALVAVRPEVRPHFIGALRGIEREILPTTEFPHTLLALHPLYRSTPWRNWRTVTGLTSGWRQISALASTDRPKLVVATGGYASGAALSWSLLSRVPYVLQEQNSFPGKTVRAFSRWAREIYLGFPEAVALLPPNARAHAVDTGNPIEPPSAIRGDRASLRRIWGLDESVRIVILAFGGSQGSAALNTLVDGWIARGLPRGIGVIWGTGRDHFNKHRARASERVAIRPYLAPIADAYAASDFAIARAGAMTTAELLAWGIPMLLIPLPTAAADHQTANARALAAAGAARWIAQSDATVDSLDTVVREMTSDDQTLSSLSNAARMRGRPESSARIAAHISALLDRATASDRARSA